TAAVVSRRDLLSPYVTLGGICASFLTKRLKLLLKQQRPQGSAFDDPGMPSSHALVTFFMAIAWSMQLGWGLAPVLLSAAVLISVLRVVCGHHSWAQISVGAAMGASMAAAWMALGKEMLSSPSAMSMAVVYFLYIAGSVIFLTKIVRKSRSRKLKQKETAQAGAA
ncbi:unnamed protein product, partial [Effrenium voratum]